MVVIGIIVSRLLKIFVDCECSSWLDLVIRLCMFFVFRFFMCEVRVGVVMVGWCVVSILFSVVMSRKLVV